MLIERNKSVISSQDILLKSTTILNFTYKPISSVIAHDWVSCTVLDVFLSWFLHLACSFRLVGLFCVRVRGRDEVKHETPERIFLHRDRLLPWRQTSDVTAEIGLLIAQIESVAVFEERGKGEGRNAKSSLRFCLKRKRQKESELYLHPTFHGVIFRWIYRNSTAACDLNGNSEARASIAFGSSRSLYLYRSSSTIKFPLGRSVLSQTIPLLLIILCLDSLALLYFIKW